MAFWILSRAVEFVVLQWKWGESQNLGVSVEIISLKNVLFIWQFSSSNLPESKGQFIKMLHSLVINH